MSQNTRAQNSGQEGDLWRNNPTPYNLRPLQPQVEEQKGDEPLHVARRRTTRHQPRRETRTERLKQRIDMLTELVNKLVATLGQNAANATPAIPPGIPLANAEGEEVLPPQEGGEVAVGGTRQTPMYDERAHGVGVEQGTKIGETHQTHVHPNMPETQYSVGLNE